MKIAINKCLRRWAGVCAGLLLAATACTNDPTGLDGWDGTPDDGTRSEMTLEFGLSASSAGVRTRAGEGFDSSEVQSIWVGVFDTTTGELVGKTMPLDRGSYGLDADYEAALANYQSKLSQGLATVSILYYDAHPTVRIFGVANYEDVKATGHEYAYQDVTLESEDRIYKTEELQPTGEELTGDLIELLNHHVRTLDDLFALSVDTESADAALAKHGAPLMMGVLAKEGTALAGTTHYTVSTFDNQTLSGSSFKTPSNWTGDTDVLLIPGNPSNSTNGMFERLKYQVLDGHKIHLRRLLSEVKVAVKAGDGVEISNVQYRRVNMPKEVYLQERTTYTGDTGDHVIFKASSPNKADFKQTTVTKDGVTKVANASDCYASDLGFTETNDPSSFTFYHYENKHWGTANTTKYEYRDVKRPDTSVEDGPIFRALCPYANKDDADAKGPANDYNNYASYFEIKCVVKTADQVAEATYLIHEGYCNNSDGTATTTEAVRSRDFMCVRNTSYTYNVTINGVNSISVSVNGADHSLPGASGDVWKVAKVDVEDDDEATGDGIDAYKYRVAWNLSTVAEVADLVYRYYYANGGDPISYGTWGDLVENDLPVNFDYLQLPEITRTEVDADHQVLVFSNENDPDEKGVPFAEWIQSDPKDATVYLGFKDPQYDIREANAESHLQQLYIYEEDSGLQDNDGCTTRSYFCFERIPADPRMPLTAPSVVGLLLTNDFAPASDNPAVEGHVGTKATIKWESPYGPDGFDGGTVAYKLYYKPAEQQYREVAVDLQATCEGAAAPYTWTAELVLTDELVAAFNKLTANVYSPSQFFAVQAISEGLENYKDSKLGTETNSGNETKCCIYPTSLSWNFNRLSAGTASNLLYACDSMLSGLASDDPYCYLKLNGTTAAGNIEVKNASTTITLNPLADGIITLKASGSGSDYKANTETDDAGVTYEGRSVYVKDAQQTQRSFGGANKNAPIEISFHVVADEPVTIYAKNSLLIYSVSIQYHDHADPNYHTWDFSSTAWDNVMAAFTWLDTSSNKNLVGLLNGAMTIDGLHIEAAKEKYLRGNSNAKATDATKYIQTGGCGDNSNVFWFYAHKSGKVIVTASSTKSGESDRNDMDRFVAISQDGQEIGRGNTAGALRDDATKVTIEATVTVTDEPVKVEIRSIETENTNGAAYIYKIEYKQ